MIDMLVWLYFKFCRYSSFKIVNIRQITTHIFSILFIEYIYLQRVLFDSTRVLDFPSDRSFRSHLALYPLK